MLWALRQTPEKTKTTLAASALGFLVVFPLGLLSYYEHVLCIAPSVLIELYLLLTVGFDATRIRTLWLMPGAGSLAATESAALAVKIGLAVAEAYRKDGLLQETGHKYTGEQLSGLYGKSLLLWMGSTLWNGMSLPLPRLAVQPGTDGARRSPG